MGRSAFTTASSSTTASAAATWRARPRFWRWTWTRVAGPISAISSPKPISGERAMRPFSRCYRAYVRGKVLSFRLNEAEFSEQERDMAAARAVKFFDLALRYASRLPRAAVIAVGGLSGTGKTAIARANAGELGLRVVSSDAIRRELFGDDKRPASYGEGVYNEEAN